MRGSDQRGRGSDPTRWRLGGISALLLRGQEFEVAEPEWEVVFKVHDDTGRQDHELVIEAGAGYPFWAPSAMNRGGSTTSYAGARGGKAIPANRGFISRLKTI